MRNYLVGAGLADPDGVLGLEMVLPNAESPVFPLDTFVMEEPTDNRDGRARPPLVGVVAVLVMRRCGMRVGVESSKKKYIC